MPCGKHACLYCSFSPVAPLGKGGEIFIRTFSDLLVQASVFFQSRSALLSFFFFSVFPANSWLRQEGRVFLIAPAWCAAITWGTAPFSLLREALSARKSCLPTPPPSAHARHISRCSPGASKTVLAADVTLQSLQSYFKASPKRYFFTFVWNLDSPLSRLAGRCRAAPGPFHQGCFVLCSSQQMLPLECTCRAGSFPSSIGADGEMMICRWL